MRPRQRIRCSRSTSCHRGTTVDGLCERHNPSVSAAKGTSSVSASIAGAGAVLLPIRRLDRPPASIESGVKTRLPHSPNVAHIERPPHRDFSPPNARGRQLLRPSDSSVLELFGSQAPGSSPRCGEPRFHLGLRGHCFVRFCEGAYSAYRASS